MRRRRCAELRQTLVALLAAPCLLLAGHDPVWAHDDWAIVQVRFPSFQAMDEYLSAHPDVEIRTERRILGPELRVSATALSDLAARGFPYALVKGTEPGDGEATDTPPSGTSQKNSLYRFDDMVDTLETLAARYPQIAACTVIGNSREGRPIHAMKISDNPSVDEDEPTLLLVGVHHADEGVGVDVVLHFIHHALSGYGQDAGITSHVDECEIWCVPLPNPDGWMLLESEIVHAWRKNTRDNNLDGLFDPDDGVDLNRNYSFNWALGGSINPSQWTYRGPFPFSETEVVRLRDLMAQTRPSLALTYHQSGDVVIIPWTWNGQATPDSATYASIASGLATSICKLDGTPYGWYTDAGTGGYMDDWLYGVYGAFCLTVEVTTPDKPSIPQAVANNLAGALFALERLRGAQVTGRVTARASGQPVAAEVRILDIDTSALDPRQADPVHGRYRRLLVPGSYTLEFTAPGFFPIESPVTVQADQPTVLDVVLREWTSVNDASEPLPSRRLALVTHPNPARGATTLRFFLPEDGPARLEIFDLSGRLVRKLVAARGEAGWSSVGWDGLDDLGEPLASGIYVCRLVQAKHAASLRLVMLR